MLYTDLRLTTSTSEINKKIVFESFRFEKKNCWLLNTVQYRPSEKEIVIGLKVPSSDGLGLIL
jgi:hypothetical protein